MSRIPVICDRCKFPSHAESSGGADGGGSLYGHHRCADGELGNFRDIDYFTKKLKSQEKFGKAWEAER